MESDRLSHEEGSRGVTRRAWCSKSHRALEPNLGGLGVVLGLGVGHAGSASLSLLKPRQRHSCHLPGGVLAKPVFKSKEVKRTGEEPGWWRAGWLSGFLLANDGCVWLDGNGEERAPLALPEGGIAGPGQPRDRCAGVHLDQAWARSPGRFRSFHPRRPGRS